MAARDIRTGSYMSFDIFRRMKTEQQIGAVSCYAFYELGSRAEPAKQTQNIREKLG